MALKLKAVGITRVRPLLGGFAEWKQRGYKLEDALEKIGWRSPATSA
jgi:3-mercaptopyruvate sulfurtransferase SseA